MSGLIHPLADAAQLESSGTRLDGVPAQLENSIRFAGARLTQTAGVLLRLPQDVIARAIICFTRFWIGSEGGSLCDYGAHDISAACLYLMSKLSAHPKTPRNVLTVYAYLSSKRSFASATPPVSAEDWDVLGFSEGTYQAQRDAMMRHEAIVLRTLGFQTHVALPYTLCINYLQSLDVFNNESGQSLAKRAVAHLNSALLSPQLLFVTHQAPSLASAAIYIAAREVGVKLPADEWWETFDTSREELGFLVAAMVSMDGFVAQELERWKDRNVPMTVQALKAEIEK